MSKEARKDKAVALHDQIRNDLATHYPTLHLFAAPGARVEVRGTFPVHGDGGRVLDRFQVTIELPAGYPRVLPVTRETGGRIPWTPDRHMDPDGKACVLLPDERWRVFPLGARFIEYLRGPLHSFFLSQVAFETDGKWPFGEWGHGAVGIIQHYAELLGTSNLLTIWRFLEALAQEDFHLSLKCPCGSGAKVETCCRDKLVELRRKIDRSAAGYSLSQLSSAVGKLKACERLFTVSGPAAVLMRHAGSALALPNDSK